MSESVARCRQRAIDPVDKERKRAALLESARDLFLQDPTQLPSVSAIAKRCGLAKGTVYLYFKTKEEIFLVLLGEGHSGLTSHIASYLDSQRDQKALFSEHIVDSICSYIEKNPEYLPLSSFSISVIEQNVSLAEIKEYKIQMLNDFDTLASKVSSFIPLEHAELKRLTMQTHALMLGVWQAFSYPTKLSPLLDDPAFEVFTIPYKKQLQVALKSLWAGALKEVNVTN